MGGDFISEIREIRGTGLATEPATDGIYHDIAIKDTDEDGTPRPGAGIYGSMQVMHESVGSVSSHIPEIDIVGNDLAGEDTTGTAYPDGLSKVMTVSDDLNDADSKIQAVIANKANIDTVANDTVVVNAVGTNISAVTNVDAHMADITDVLPHTDNINVVADNVASVVTVSSNMADVNTTVVNMDDINLIGQDLQGQWSYIDDAGSITEAVSDASGVSKVTTVADDINKVVLCADNIAVISETSAVATDITTIVDDVVPHMDVILESPANANTTTTKANEASASATIASDASTSASSSASIATDMKEDAEASKDLAETAYNDTVAIYGDSTDVENAVNSATASAQTATDAKDKASKWAEEDVDVEVETDKYSSKHYNIKAEGHASDATISAGDAQTSANLSADSATASEDSKVAAEAAKDLTEQLHEDFRDAYLGYLTEDPDTDNDGDELRVGTLYFNTTSGHMKSWNGENWRTTFADSAGAALTANNLNDMSDIAESRTNLDVYSKAESDTITDDHKNDTANPHEVTKTQVGLGNCDDTSDADKPVSTATQDALDDKFDKSGGTVTGATTFEQDVNGRDITADGDKLDLITVTATTDLDSIRDNSAVKLQTIDTDTVYDDSNTDTNYKMYIEDGKIILEEL